MKIQYRIKTTRPHYDAYGDTKGRPNVIDYSPWLDVPKKKWMRRRLFTQAKLGYNASDHTPANTDGTATDIEWRLV